MAGLNIVCTWDAGFGSCLQHRSAFACGCQMCCALWCCPHQRQALRTRSQQC